MVLQQTSPKGNPFANSYTHIHKHTQRHTTVTAVSKFIRSIEYLHRTGIAQDQYAQKTDEYKNSQLTVNCKTNMLDMR